jgi:hypothetical protein
MIERYTPQSTPILKIGGHFQRSDIEDLDAVWQLELSAEELSWARGSMLRHLSLLGLGLGEGVVSTPVTPASTRSPPVRFPTSLRRCSPAGRPIRT